MISERDLKEVRERDFLKNHNHYNDLENIETKLVFGKHFEGGVFLTIILPVYDHPEEFIKRALDSALEQKCDYKYQIIVIDDYAVEKGQTTTEKYVRKLNDPRVIYYKNMENMGVFGNWNRAVSLAESEWVSFLHSDDFLKDNYLQNMYDIIKEHPDIDQLACNYKKLDFLNEDIDVEREKHGVPGVKKLRKVKYTEYLYEMKTSVKGSFYKRDKLLEIGGFRSQGDGIGLDDYPLMLRFAYYYNTYLIEDDLYLNSWAHNDSLNTKHWYPELVENYYMWLYFAKKETGFKSFFYEKAAKCLLLERARIYKSGKSWVGVPIEIDYDELKHDCELKNTKINRFWEALSFGMVYLFQKSRNRIQFMEDIEINKAKVISEEAETKNDAIMTIASAMKVKPNEITNITVLKKGMTNRSFVFSVADKKYIMRIPGEGTDKLLNRKQEAEVYKKIADKNICDDIVYINPDNGYKITRFIEGARVCDPEDRNDITACMKKLKEFHNLKLKVSHEFDLFKQIEFYESLWNGEKSVFRDYEKTKQNIFLLKKFIEQNINEKVLTHIDAIPDNFLFTEEGEVRLIDWEYAAMQDPHVDLAMFCIYSFYDRSQIDDLIDIYFDGKCDKKIRLKIYCYIAAGGLLWSNWCEYKRTLGVEFGEYSLRQYRYAKEYFEIVQRELADMQE